MAILTGLVVFLMTPQAGATPKCQVDTARDRGVAGMQHGRLSPVSGLLGPFGPEVLQGKVALMCVARAARARQYPQP